MRIREIQGRHPQKIFAGKACIQLQKKFEISVKYAVISKKLSHAN